MSKLSNELLMLQYLSMGRKYSLQELADKLEVTKRMIRTYKEDIEKSGIFIETIHGPYGGYVLRNNTFLPSPIFTHSDCALLEKLNETSNEELEDLIAKMKYFVLESKEPLDTNTSVYKIISRAIKEKRKVKILYFTEGKGERERIIHPYHIIYYGNGFGCAAFCELKKDLRHFAFSRIKNIVLLDWFY